MELISGLLYFPTHENLEHLAMIEKSSGPFPQWMIRDCRNSLKKHFVSEINPETH